MIRWINPKNGDLSVAAIAIVVTAAALLAVACWARMSAAGADEHLRFGAPLVGAMAPTAWGLLPTAVFKNRVERMGFAALCVALSATAVAFLLIPQVFA